MRTITVDARTFVIGGLPTAVNWTFAENRKAAQPTKDLEALVETKVSELNKDYLLTDEEEVEAASVMVAAIVV